MAEKEKNTKDENEVKTENVEKETEVIDISVYLLNLKTTKKET